MTILADHLEAIEPYLTTGAELHFAAIEAKEPKETIESGLEALNSALGSVWATTIDRVLEELRPNVSTSDNKNQRQPLDEANIEPLAGYFALKPLHDRRRPLLRAATLDNPFMQIVDITARAEETQIKLLEALRLGRNALNGNVVLGGVEYKAYETARPDRQIFTMKNVPRILVTQANQKSKRLLPNIEVGFSNKTSLVVGQGQYVETKTEEITCPKIAPIATFEDETARLSELRSRVTGALTNRVISSDTLLVAHAIFVATGENLLPSGTDVYVGAQPPEDRMDIIRFCTQELGTSLNIIRQYLPR